MKKVEIFIKRKGGVVKCLIDEADFFLFRDSSWFAHNYKGAYYARRTEEGKTILLHRKIMECVPGDGKIVDHINGDTLDNRRANLRIVDTRQSLWNRGPMSESGYVGVTRHRDGRFVGKVRQDGNLYYCGLHDTASEAAIAVNKKLLALRGEYARLNKV